ncbi:hypothetical protein BIW11_11419 [Tropilaelaps mercedesae]|uniref:Uncharacterized protein n=1 Tax=Tropilaelaps mercedesae TaxID=418985 RepID=A0A1V9XBP5_9ACAR|nr:hypothetical protein BIW11_11419 [Tropilaelaps mercedesae]
MLVRSITAPLSFISSNIDVPPISYNMDRCSEEGLRMLSGALAELCKAPPERTLRLPTVHDRIEYIYMAHQLAIRKMAERGYKMPPMTDVDSDYEKWVTLQEALRPKLDAITDQKAGNKTVLEEALRRVQDEIRQRVQNKKYVEVKKVVQQDSDRADLSDSTYGSQSSRSQSLLVAKSKLRHNVRESSWKRNLRARPSDTNATSNIKGQKMAIGQTTDHSSVSQSLARPSRSRVPKKGPTRHNSQSAMRASTQPRNEVAQSRLAKGQRIASVEKKAPPVHGNALRASSFDRAEFARAQNQRVQQAKERREQQQQQPEKTSKESIPSIKNSKSVKTDFSETMKEKVSKTNHEVSPTISKTVILPGNEAFSGETLLESNKLPMNRINSTFVTGAEGRPMFDATMIISDPPGVIGSTAPSPNTKDESMAVLVQTNATFAKPSLSYEVKKTNCKKTFVSAYYDRNTKLAPHWTTANPTVDDTLLNPMDSYCNYGLEDLCSDSDNTDDEQRPRKQVPEWARMDSVRFAKRVTKQKALMTDISKYGHYEIVMPNYVDLEALFGNSAINLRHDTSSLLWNTTQTFIN